MIAIDTNVFAYAAFTAIDDKQRRARELIARAALIDVVIPAQVFIEFANASLKRGTLSIAIVRLRLAEWAAAFPVAMTRTSDILAALNLVDTARVAYFDALIVAVASAAGATTLFTEDMQDGARVGGVLIINPFEPANNDALAALL